jgi:hypothetical protein
LTLAIVAVPGENSGYAVTVDVDRSTTAELSIRNSATWTFRSGHVDTQRLPVSVVRFKPPLDDTNTAPPGDPLFVVPIEVQHQSGSSARRTRSLTVRV